MTGALTDLFTVSKGDCQVSCVANTRHCLCHCSNEMQIANNYLLAPNCVLCER